MKNAPKQKEKEHCESSTFCSSELKEFYLALLRKASYKAEKPPTFVHNFTIRRYFLNLYISLCASTFMSPP